MIGQHHRDTVSALTKNRPCAGSSILEALLKTVDQRRVSFSRNYTDSSESEQSHGVPVGEIDQMESITRGADSVD